MDETLNDKNGYREDSVNICTCGFGEFQFVESDTKFYCAICGGEVKVSDSLRNPSNETRESIRQKNILIIDDQAFFLKSIQDILENEYNCRVIGVNNGIDALSCIAKDLRGEQKVDLIILDLELPEISGITMLKIIRALRNDIPILILTTTPPIDSLISDLKKYRANRYLWKSTSKLGALLIRNVKKLLEEI